jgi:short subunit dehydrogenase-like uncharacterized protein
VFGLDTRSKVESALSGVDAVVNAAGPFAETGLRLAKAAISVGTHYVDINGEVNTYKTLDDLARAAQDRRVRVVSGAGFTSTMSDVLLRWAIELLAQNAAQNDLALGVVRIAVSDMTQLSQGSIRTMRDSIREQVSLVREGSYVHVPVGMLERPFDFASLTAPTRRPGVPDPSGYRTASAANLLDTCTAFETSRAMTVPVGSIESYIEMALPIRLAYQAGALSAVYLHLPLIRNIDQMQIAQLPEGPDEQERKQSRHTIILQIESPYREPWIDWRLETPNSYDVTARTALAVAVSVTSDTASAIGWMTPSRALELPRPSRLGIQVDAALPLVDAPFQDCTLEGRPVMAQVG